MNGCIVVACSKLVKKVEGNFNPAPHATSQTRWSSKDCGGVPQSCIETTLLVRYRDNRGWDNYRSMNAIINSKLSGTVPPAITCFRERIEMPTKKTSKNNTSSETPDVKEEYVIDEKGLKLTAAIYATAADLLEHVKATGRLPEKMTPRPWLVIPMRLIIEKRGTDITLTPNEQLMYDALLRERRLPLGNAVIVNQEKEADQ